VISDSCRRSIVFQPGGEDGVEAGLGEGALAAVVEVDTVLEGWVLLAVGFELAIEFVVEWGHGVALVG
jgi:hypothetical protein